MTMPEHADILQQGVLSDPSCPRIFFTPMAPTNGGRIIGASSKRAENTFFPANSKRSAIHANAHRQRKRRRCARHRQQERVAQPLDVNRIAKNLPDVNQSVKCAPSTMNAPRRVCRTGIQKEHREERAGQRENDKGKCA